VLVVAAKQSDQDTDDILTPPTVGASSCNMLQLILLCPCLALPAHMWQSAYCYSAVCAVHLHACSWQHCYMCPDDVGLWWVGCTQLESLCHSVLAGDLAASLPNSLGFYCMVLCTGANLAICL